MMNKKRRRLYIRSSILGVLAILIGYVFYSNFTGEETLVEEGNTAPNFELHTLQGDQAELEEFRGQGVFLNFWGTYCPPCEEEFPYIDNQYAEYKEKGVEVLAVNVGESDLAVERFVNRHQLSFPILMDENKAVLDRYGIGPLPTTFLINEDGEVMDILTGGMTENDIREYMERIKPS